MNKSIKKLEQILSVLLLLIVPLLWVVTGELRSSISDYAYSKADNLFVGLLWLSACMFFYNATYTNKYYNAILGISLIGVSLTDYLDYPILHYGFAGLFFLGSMTVMVVFTSSKQRLYKILAASFMLLVLIGHFVFGFYSLLVAEWICMAPLSVHFLGESLNKID